MPNNPRGLDLTTEQQRNLRRTITCEPLPWSIMVAQLDPDGIACAEALREIMKAQDVEARIYYGGGYDDPQNRHIRRIFRLDRTQRSGDEMPAEGPVALVDSCRLTDARFSRPIDPRRIRLVIDHHKPDERLVRPWRFVHICQTGAAATLLWRQGKALGVRFSRKTATLIALAILSDTNKFRGACITNADRFAFAEASAQADQKLLARCHDFKMPPRYYELAGKTYLGARLHGRVVYAHPNRRVRRAESGYVSHFADSLLQREDCAVSLVWCLEEDRIRASIRASDPRIDLGTLIAHVFGRRWGGAKNGSGGAQVPLTDLRIADVDAFDDELIAAIDRLLRRRLARHLSSL